MTCYLSFGVPYSRKFLVESRENRAVGNLSLSMQKEKTHLLLNMLHISNVKNVVRNWSLYCLAFEASVPCRPVTNIICMYYHSSTQK
jgi:hypothetical protein